MLRLNVGHVLSRSVGFIRQVRFSGEQVTVASDLVLTRLASETQLTRTPQGILLEGTIDTTRNMECVRCLSVYAWQAEVNISELYTYPPEPEVEWTIDEDCMLNIAPLLRELLLVEEPMQALCGPDCRGLCPDCGQNWNIGDCACPSESGDARFAVLRELLGAD
jgi:uncharacterized protein